VNTFYDLLGKEMAVVVGCRMKISWLEFLHSKEEL